jgi:hypothetical protein
MIATMITTAITSEVRVPTTTITIGGKPALVSTPATAICESSGVAYNAKRDFLHVSCNGGALLLSLAIPPALAAPGETP